MPVKLITYDLNRESVRPPLLSKLKASYPNWAMLSESSYAVDTTASPSQIYDTLKPLIDSNDNIYIITLSKPWMGFGSKDVNEWLDARLTY